MRNAMIAILTLGPQYGLQLRSELARRTGGILNVNSGQVYQTLDRLQRDGLICSAGATPDGLPLYELTPGGNNFAQNWLHVCVALETKHPWETMLTQVLITRSLPGVDSAPLIASYQDFWIGLGKQSEENCEGEGTSQRLGSAAKKRLSEAALAWLQDVQLTSDIGTELDADRPARGRPRSVTPN